jgi:hypothetical protein
MIGSVEYVWLVFCSLLHVRVAFRWFAFPGFFPLQEKKISSCLSVRMDHFGFHWTNCHEILYLRIVRKFVKKIEV